MLLMLAQEQYPNAEGVRPTSWFIIRRSYEDLKKTIFKDWKQHWRHFASCRKTTEQPMRDFFRYALPDGTIVEAEFIFLALDREEDIERFRGGNFTGGLGNEVKQLHLNHLTEGVRRSRRFPSEALGGVMVNEDIGMVICDTNAPNDDHWLHEYEQKDPDGWRILVQPPAVFKFDERPDLGPPIKSPSGSLWVVNPKAENIQNLTPAYYPAILRTSQDDRILADCCNRYTHIQEGDPVYPEYNDATHCVEFDPDPSLGLIIGGDGGLTPSAVFLQVSARGQVRVFDELQAERMAVKQFWRDVVYPHYRAKWGDFEVVGASFDPAGNAEGEGEGKSAIGLLNDEYETDDPLRLPFYVYPCETNDPTRRQDAVRTPLTRMIDGAPAFLLHPRCKTLRAGFNGKYCYRKMRVVGPARYHQKPDKNAYSHCFVGSTLISTPNGLRRIDEIGLGDYVSTPLGPRMVTATMRRSASDLYEVNGQVCTGEHPFATTRGFVRADALQYDDVYTESYLWGAEQFIQYRNSTESGTTESLRGTTSRSMGDICTAMYGSITTASSLAGITRIMSTAIKAIIGWKTLMSFLLPNTPAFTASHGAGQFMQNGIWTTSVHRPSNGIVRKKGESGTAGTLKRWLQACRFCRTSVCDAARHIRQRRGRGSAAFALLHAKRQRGLNPALMMLLGVARTVARILWQTNTQRRPTVRVSARRLHRSAIVYDLTVDEAHVFYAGGMLVSNCHDALQYGCVYAGGYEPETNDWWAEDADTRNAHTGY